MDNKAHLDKLAAQVSILEHHIKRLNKKPDELHELDIELMAEKIKVLYDLVHDLQPGNLPKKKEIPVVNQVEKVPLVEVKPEPEIPAPKAPEMSSELNVEEIQEEKLIETPSVPEVRAEPEIESEVTFEQPATRNEEPVASSQQPETAPVTSDEQPAIRNEEPITSNEQPETDPIPHTTDPIPHTTDPIPKTTADLFSGPTTIADSFQAKDDNSIAAKVNPQAVEDLKMAIGINDKFLFINELFKGDPGVYNQAIQSLNIAGGMNEAEAAIESFRGEYEWADNSEAYHRLKKIVMSKYNG